MNITTAERYRRVGAILKNLQQQTDLTDLEQILIAELAASDIVFIRSVAAIKLIVRSDDGLTLDEIARLLSVNKESAKVIIRSLKNGGFRFIESELENDTPYKGETIFELDLAESALTTLINQRTPN
jgi:hypothetical protein